MEQKMQDQIEGSINEKNNLYKRMEDMSVIDIKKRILLLEYQLGLIDCSTISSTKWFVERDIAIFKRLLNSKYKNI
jgi:hypothetical protein